MAYGLSTPAFVEDGPVEQIGKAVSLRTAARSWHALSEACRLAIIEQQLRPANDRIAAARSRFDPLPQRERDRKDDRDGRRNV